MENIQNLIKNRHFSKNTVPKRYDNWWTDCGRQMTDHFKRNCFWLPHKYPRHKIHEKFAVAKRENWTFEYFIGALRK